MILIYMKKLNELVEWTQFHMSGFAWSLVFTQRLGAKLILYFCSFIQRCDQYAEYDAFIWAPDPSNPWVSDDVTLWEQDKSL